MKTKYAYLILGLASVSQFVVASGTEPQNIVVLDMQDANVCHQQLLDSQDKNPLIMEYKVNHCAKCEEYRPIYEQAARDNPNRTFFTADLENVTAAVKSNCLQETSFSLLPRTKAVWKNDKKEISNAYIAQSGVLSKEQLSYFIDQPINK